MRGCGGAAPLRFSRMRGFGPAAQFVSSIPDPQAEACAFKSTRTFRGRSLFQEPLAEVRVEVYTSSAGISECGIPGSHGGEICKGVSAVPFHFENRTIRGGLMPHFLTQVAYNEQAWQSLVSNPQNRLDAIRPVIEKLGGRVVNAYFAFGDYDFVLITELPDNVSAAALAIAASAGGACKSVKTTPLMENAEGLEALRKAATSGYRAPTSGRTASA